MLPWILLFMLIAGGAGAIFFAVWTVRRAEKQEEEQFRAALVQELQGKRASSFRFEEFVSLAGVSQRSANAAADEIYSRLCKRAFADGQLTAPEQENLRSLERILNIESGRAAAIQRKCKEEVYSEIHARVLADGSISEDEVTEMRDLRRRLGFTSKDALDLTGWASKDAYIAKFREVILDGRVTTTELQELTRYRDALCIFTTESTTLIRDDVMKLYRSIFYSIVQDGDISQDEVEKLRWIEKQFGLTVQDTESYWAQIGEVQRLAEYRRGNLPTVRTRKLLEGGELCHWDGQCRFVWQTARTAKDTHGGLVVTSNRVIFGSATKNFAFVPSRIMDIQLYSDGLQLQTSGNQGTGCYFVSNPRELEAIVSGLARKHKYLLSENYSSSRSRHIPDEIKRAVWDRDSGRCVRCSATEYLEYDHIIPHSRGGANTVNNVQILCRRCNLLKSDRI